MFRAEPAVAHLGRPARYALFPWGVGLKVDHPLSTGPAGLLLLPSALLQSVPPSLESRPAIQDEVLSV